MSNANSPMGFRPLGTNDAGVFTGKVIPCIIPASDGTATFRWDLMKLSGGAAQVTIPCEFTGLYLPIAIQAAATNTTILGSAVGFAPQPTQFTTLYRLASTQQVVFVTVDPNQKFLAQTNGASGTAAANATKNYSLTAATTGSTVTGISGMMVDDSSQATTAALELKMLGYQNSVDNTPASQYNKVVVMLNESIYKDGVAGV